MRNYNKTIGALAAASTLVAGYAMAGTEGVAAQTGLQGELHAGVSSDYIWRGTQIGSGALVETGIDLKGQVAGLNLSGGAWYGTLSGDRSINTGWTSRPGAVSDYDELDLYAQASKDFGFATVSVGGIAYLYPKFMDVNQNELYVGLSRELFAGITGSLNYYYGFEGRYNVDAGATPSYLQLAFTKTIKFTDCLSLDLGSSLGYCASEGTLNDVGVTAALNYQFAKNARLSPYLGETWGLENKNKQYLGFERSSQFYGGVKVAVGF